MKKTNLLLLTLLILVSNLWMFFIGSSTETNFTGLMKTHLWIVIFWAFFNAFLNIGCLNTIATTLNKNKKVFVQIEFATITCLVFALIFQYDQSKSILFTNLHLLFAYGFFLGINSLFLYLLLEIQSINPSLFQKIIFYYILLGSICICIFMIYMSVNGLFEIIFTTGFGLINLYFLDQLKK